MLHEQHALDLKLLIAVYALGTQSKISKSHGPLVHQVLCVPMHRTQLLKAVQVLTKWTPNLNGEVNACFYNYVVFHNGLDGTRTHHIDFAKVNRPQGTCQPVSNH
jgi:hypothetical protein